MIDRDHDAQVRAATFSWLEAQVEKHGDVLPWSLLIQGFEFEGERVPLVSMQGIFKPRVLDQVPLSIRSSAKGPYDDSLGPDGRLSYRYRGTDPAHRDNVGLRLAMRLELPLVYFLAIAPGKYLATWPVYVVDDDPTSLSFAVLVDDPRGAWLDLKVGSAGAEPGAAARREYLTRKVRYRLHQRTFRERVLRAYRRQCALCRFRHEELLDAAHIIGDLEEDGEPIVQNGLSLCRLHHGAYDRDFLGIRPDYVVEVRPDLMDEKDGPTLLHGIQGMHGQQLVLPRKVELRPDPARLEVRYEVFRASADKEGK